MALLSDNSCQGNPVWEQVKYTSLGLVLVTSRTLVRLYPLSVYRGTRCWLMSVLWLEKLFTVVRECFKKILLKNYERPAS